MTECSQIIVIGAVTGENTVSIFCPVTVDCFRLNMMHFLNFETVEIDLKSEIYVDTRFINIEVQILCGPTNEKLLRAF